MTTLLIKHDAIEKHKHVYDITEQAGIRNLNLKLKSINKLREDGSNYEFNPFSKWHTVQYRDAVYFFRITCDAANEAVVVEETSSPVLSDRGGSPGV